MTQSPSVTFFSLEHKQAPIKKRSALKRFFSKKNEEVFIENFHTKEILRKIVTALSEVQFTNLNRITIAGDTCRDYFYDLQNISDDFSTEMKKFIANFIEPDERYLLQLSLEKEQNDIKTVLTLTLQKKHSRQIGFLHIAVNSILPSSVNATQHYDLLLQSIVAAVIKHISVAEYQKHVDSKQNTVSLINTTNENLNSIGSNKDKTVKVKVKKELGKVADAVAIFDKEFTEEFIDDSRALFPLFGITPGVTTKNQLEKLGGIHAKDKDDKGNLYKYYVVNGVNFWYEGNLANHLYMTYTDAIPNRWRNLGFDWAMSYNQAVAFLQNICQYVSIIKEPQIIKHFSGSGNSFTASVEGIQKCRNYSIRINIDFNYSKEFYSANDAKTIYSVSVEAL